MAWTDIPTVALNSGTLKSQWDTYIKANQEFLKNPPRCRVYNSSNITLDDATNTALTFDSERFDNDSMHDSSTNPNRITINTPGTYAFGASVAFAGNGIGDRMVAINVSTGGAITAPTQPAASAAISWTVMNPSGIWECTVGMWFEVVAWQGSGGLLNVVKDGSHSPEFWAYWIGD